MSGERFYWRSLEERDGRGATSHGGAPEPDAATPPLSRRSFLKAAGFTLPAALAGCRRAPVEKAIPFLVQPEEVVPGTSLWYASTCRACEAACGVLVKNRDGRPIKIEGNPEHPLSRGGLCARGQAAVLGLYDEHRLSSPRRRGLPARWEQVDEEIRTQLADVRANGKAIRFLTGTVVGGTRQRLIRSFLADFPDARHVVYDALSCSAILDAHERTHGVRVLPRFRFEAADVIVSFDADFLGTWVSPVEYTAAWRVQRRATPERAEMSYHAHIEPRLSLTGSKADRRWVVRPSRLRDALTSLAAALARRAGKPAPPASAREVEGMPAVEIEALAERLWAARPRCLVVCGVNNLALQFLCNDINHLLQAYGTTIDLQRPSRQVAGDDRQLAHLVDELRSGTVAALLVADANPAYELAAIPGLREWLAQVPLLISFARWEDETSQLAGFVCPDHHPLESWDDAQPLAGVWSLVQPAITPLGGTRAMVESLAAWRGEVISARELVRDTWRTEVYPANDLGLDFEEFWKRALGRGVIEVNAPPVVQREFSPHAVQLAARAPDADGMELVVHPSVAMGDGRHALNPWLQELPDPITKVTWDNVATLSPRDAERLGVREGDVVRLEVPSSNGPAAAVELPVFVQPGQADGTVAAAWGYGHAGSERFATIGPDWLEAGERRRAKGPVGVSVAPFVTFAPNGTRGLWRGDLQISPTRRRRPLACTQTHHSLAVPPELALPGGETRDPVREMSLSTLANSDGHGAAVGGHGELSLWPDDHPYLGHHWGMVVDLSVCTGCSACVIACQAENNVPVVGRDEVRRRREMHWLRIDTYFTGDGSEVATVHQPMMCQQCDHAPCETVCPVLATVHSAEGLNQQVYNRCVGTRYCANNCPYKTRRFNWFNYHRQAGREDLALNPDVTVRSRGVMEKCTFCVQRIAEGKIAAKAAGGPLADGAIRPACAQSCPADAIVFGDLNDGQSRVAQLMMSPRRYRVLEELGVRPSVGYLAVVRHGGGGKGEASHG